MDEKTLGTQQLADEWLEAATGGTRANARLEVRVRAVADDEIEAETVANDKASVMSSPWIVLCPNCLHTLRYCTCARR